MDDNTHEAIEALQKSVTDWQSGVDSKLGEFGETFKTFGDRLDAFETKHNRGNIPNETKDYTQVPPQVWRDADTGKPVHVIKSGESLTKTLYGNAEAKEEWNVPLGEMILFKATGEGDPLCKKVLSEGSDTAGGFLAPGFQAAQLIDKVRNATTVFRAGAQLVPFTSKELTIARLSGDPTVGWFGENATISASDPTFERIRFVPRKVAALVKMSRELVDDAANAAQAIENALVAAMALEIDRAAYLGDGDSNEPRGLFAMDGVSSQTSVGSPTYDDFITGITNVRQNNFEPNAMVCGPTVIESLAKLKSTGGGEYLLPPAMYGDLSKYVSNQLSTSRAVVADFTNLMIGQRQGIEIEVTREADTAFADHQVWIKATARLDVQAAHEAAFNVLTGIS